MIEMFNIHLTEITEDSAHPERVAGVALVDDRELALEICTAIQPYLRDGVELHFVTADE